MKRQWLHWYLTLISLPLVMHNNVHALPKIVIACCMCGTRLTPNEIQLNIEKGINLKKFLCFACWDSKGKSDDEQSEAFYQAAPPPSPASSFYSSSSFSEDSPIENTIISSLDNETYYGSKELKLAATRFEDWEVENIPFVKKKPKRKVYYRRGNPLFIKKIFQKPSVLKKDQPVTASTSTVSSQSITPFSALLEKFFPQPPNTSDSSKQLDQHVFNTVFGHLVQKPWFQSPKTVIVTDDSYIFFDLEEKKCIFFPTKEKFDDYAKEKKITHELKIVSDKENHLLMQIEKSFSDYAQTMNTAFEDHTQSINATFDKAEKDRFTRINQIDAEYSATVKKILEEHEKRSLDIIKEYLL